MIRPLALLAFIMPLMWDADRFNASTRKPGGTIALTLLLLALQAPALAHTGGSGSSWRSTSGGYKVTWTHSDLRAVPLSAPDKIVFSAKRLAREEFTRDQDAKNHLATETRSFDLLSLTGTIMSYEDRRQGNILDSHPYGETKIVAINLKRGGLPAKLTDIFFPEDVFNALINDKVIQKALEQVGSQPTDLDQLLRAFGDGVEVETEATGHSGPLCFKISRDFLTQFAFHHIDKDKVWVRIGLSGTPKCRYECTELGITLPVPQMLQLELEAADSGKSGMLMKDSETHAKLINTTVALDASKPPKRTASAQ
ncbi:MAG TPA: hypothetical protein V6C81_20785 [Planktothrix sp.]|jgi:hypothetical protein